MQKLTQTAATQIIEKNKDKEVVIVLKKKLSLYTVCHCLIIVGIDDTVMIIE